MNKTVLNPQAEEEIARYLASTPDFFHRHAELLAAVQLTSPHGNRAVSLQERQAEMLRDKIKTLEHRIMDMVRYGNENMVIADKIQRWAISLFLAHDEKQLPDYIAREVQVQFGVPQVAIKVWDVAPAYGAEPFAQGVSEDARSFASSMTGPYCGVNSGFQAAEWLPEPMSALSLALMPLRAGDIAEARPAFGMLVLASPDAQRFHGGMGTDFLERIGELASSALSRLR